MSTDTDGMSPEDRDRLNAEIVHRAADSFGADLDDCHTKVGFIAAVAAAMTRAGQLSEADRALHAAAMFDLINTISADDPNFVAGWNASLQTQMVLMKLHLNSGGLDKPGYDVLLQNAAYLTRLPDESGTSRPAS